MSPTTSVVFAGTPAFAVPSLEALIADSFFRVSLVISQPDRPAGRKQILTPSPVKECALRHGIRVFQPEDINATYAQADLTCDFLVVVAYGQILRTEILEISRTAPINLHASLLPRWRGASPLQHALLAGDTETGVTVQKMAPKLDTGDILAQVSVSLTKRETFSSLHDRLAKMGATLLTETLQKPLSPRPQGKENVSLCTKLTRSDGFVDTATMTAEDIDRRVRALVPWPGVRCTIEGSEVKLLETALKQEEDSLAWPCAEQTTLFIRMLQPSGKKPMTGAEWQRGKRM
ncbi:methionyl-tRNA formyltransferase [Candidatus Peregrinibacteria bacterium CG10_big_fil_rev_8_21_14_0_10_49_10]|nr:MAG: methionyl-tRNA formyltransferase [Candidatus Peregrinibacteria bacterium CG10_big_fil_rev_8_21_14_0_10_49_10]